MPGRLFALFSALFVLAACSHSGRAPAAAGDPMLPAEAIGAARQRAHPRDVYVLLSGGGTPLSNNYSQYLQARAIAAFFERACPPDSTWVFFGAGNRDGTPPVLADARREIKRDGLIVQSWVPGTLKNNRPATRESFLRALREEILPAVHGGGTLYLFVGDHGELAGPRDHRESAITLWQMKRGRRRASGWFTDEREILGVAELRQVLAAGLGAGRVVFCMTQCHAGGFHDLGVAAGMVPPPAWFVADGSMARTGASGVKVVAAGFTATDQQSAAAGCDADPDPDRWAGYERYLPESLFGIDLLSGEPKGRATASMAEAHAAATLVDLTIDKPRATSEHYLIAWARLIETRLTPGANLTARARQAVAEYQRAVDTGRSEAGDPAFRERRAQFQQFTRALIDAAPNEANLLTRGTRAQLEAATRSRERGGSRDNRRVPMTELRRNWAEVLRPAWKRAVLAGTVRGLGGAALEFEKHLLAVEDDGKNLLLPRGADESPLLNEVYWSAGYGELGRFNAAKADAVATWGAVRRTRIMEWASGSGDPALRAAAEKIGPGPTFMAEPPRPLSRRTAAERVLFYRRVLAAWQFLLAMEHEPALAELRELIELERTPLRPAVERSAAAGVARASRP